jgi:hypothetical protein
MILQRIHLYSKVQIISVFLLQCNNYLTDMSINLQYGIQNQLSNVCIDKKMMYLMLSYVIIIIASSFLQHLKIYPSCHSNWHKIRDIS